MDLRKDYYLEELTQKWLLRLAAGQEGDPNRLRCVIAFTRAMGISAHRNLDQARTLFEASRTAVTEPTDPLGVSTFSGRAMSREEFEKILYVLERASPKDLDALDDIWHHSLKFGNIEVRQKLWWAVRNFQHRQIPLDLIHAYLEMTIEALGVGWKCGSFHVGDESFDCASTFWRAMTNHNRDVQYLEGKGFGSDEYAAASFDYGPVYNLYDCRGIPVLGHLLRTGERVLKAADHDYGAFVPDAGIVAVTGIIGKANGSISFKTIGMGDRPALLLPEDFSVAMAHVFIEAELPSFSLSSSVRGEEFPDGGSGTLRHKWFGADWLRHTDFGRTMYHSDCLMGDLMWAKSLPAVVDESECGRSELSSLAREFQAEIRQLKKLPLHHEDDSAGFRLTAPPDVRQYMLTVPGKNGDVTVVPIGMPLRIRGWLEDGGGVGEYAVNSDVHMSGAAANLMTGRFETLAALLPIFERVRQLMNLVHGLNELKVAGFSIGNELRGSLEEYRQEKRRSAEMVTEKKSSSSLEDSRASKCEYAFFGWR